MRSYETDYAGWAEDTARAINEGRWSAIDRAALAEEVADLGRKVRWQAVSRLEVLLVHLLKQKFQPLKASRSWELTIREQRVKLKTLLRDNPSLRTKLDELIADAYEASRFAAARETELDESTFPENVPFTDAEIWGEISAEWQTSDLSSPAR